MASSHADVVLRMLLDVRSGNEAASLLMISKPTLRRWVSKGVPPSKAAFLAKVYKAVYATDMIDSLMSDAQECVGKALGHRPLLRVVRNTDGTVDGQLSLFDIPRGKGIRELLLELSDCASALRNLDVGAWLQLGMRWGAVGTDKPPDSGDRRVRGLAEGTTYWYSSERYADLFGYALDMAARVAGGQQAAVKGRMRRLPKKANRKVETIFIRVHWNVDRKKPSR